MINGGTMIVFVKIEVEIGLVLEEMEKLLVGFEGR